MLANFVYICVARGKVTIFELKLPRAVYSKKSQDNIQSIASIFFYLPQLKPARMRQMMYTDKYLGQTITQETMAVKVTPRRIALLLPILSAICPNIKFPANHPSQNRDDETFCRKLFSHTSSN